MRAIAQALIRTITRGGVQMKRSVTIVGTLAVLAKSAFAFGSGEPSVDPADFIQVNKRTSEITGVKCRAVLDFGDFQIFSGTPYMLVCNNTFRPIEKISCHSSGLFGGSEYPIIGLGADGSYNKISEIPPHGFAVINFKAGGSACDGEVNVNLKGGQRIKATGNGASMKESTTLVVSDPTEVAAK